ncbi:MAG TPA: NAD(P)-dependent oxidoreductase [Alphaproteobacteria bacterium]|nr:NAD(P)-dependent oxidoreductase [Alphaproteobacteria bacterium]
MKSVYVDCSPFMDGLLTPEIRALVPDLHINIGDPGAQQLEAMLSGAAGALNGHTAMGAELLSRCTALKTIIFLGSGAASYIDLDAAARLDIRVRTVRNYGNRTIAEHCFALILAAARRIVAMDRDLRRGVWAPLDGIELEGKTLGVVGTGGIGRELIRIASGFGMRVLAWNRSGVPADLPCREAALDELLGAADVVSLHAALAAETRGMIDSRRLGLLRPHAILVNTARGGLVDEAALVEALRQDRIAHAALDVFASEPLPPSHPFTTLENVTLTAHAAFKTPEASRRLAAQAFALLRQDLACLSAGKELPRS